MTAPVRSDAEYEDAFVLLKSMLAEWGLTNMDGAIRNILREGFSTEVAELRLRDTQEYKQRFRANETRVRNGLPALSPAEYIANEREYVSTMREYGLPAGFYDDESDFVEFLEKDVSPREVRDRAQMARSAYLDTSQQVRDQWQNLYGLTPGDAVAAFLDEDRAMGILERRARAVSIAAESTSSTVGGRERFEQLADANVNPDQARNAFREVDSRMGRDQFLGRLAGEDFTRTEAEDELLLDDETAAEERRKIYREEMARFDQNYLPVADGAMSRDRGGQS